MDKNRFTSVMVLHGDTQETLAAAIGISVSRLNAKINERNGAAFNQKEMRIIIDRYSLSGDDAAGIFFTQNVS